MRQDHTGGPTPSGPLDALRQVIPFEPTAASGPLGWVGLEAARYRAAPDAEFAAPVMTHPRLVLVSRPPERLDVRYDGVARHAPPPAGSISIVPAGSPAHWHWSGRFDWLSLALEPELVDRVAAEVFDRDPARVTVPSLDGADLPPLRAVLSAVDAELAAGGAGGRLAAESLANVLAVQLIRHALVPSQLPRGTDGALPPGRLRAVLEYVEDHLDANPSLEELAAVVHLSPYHFARQFKAATGLPPHQYVIARRVERARQLLDAGSELSLAEIAAQAGFADQSQLSHHFRRLLSVTPGQFRRSARIA